MGLTTPRWTLPDGWRRGSRPPTRLAANGLTPLSASVKKEAGAGQYLRILALARLYLDNFEHIQGSWFSEGKKTGQLSLHYGADDFGGTLIEENVLKNAKWVNETITPEVVQII